MIRIGQCSRRHARMRHGFTLLEVLAATAIFSVILGALYSAFQSATRLRERAYERIEAGIPNHYALEVLKRDLVCAVAPGGILAATFVGETQSQGSARQDILEFHTASGVIGEDENWGDVQKVSYYLSEPEDSDAAGLELMRAVTRNLLPLTEEEPAEQRLLSGVESLMFEYYSVEVWADSWDSAAEGNQAPTAVRVRIEFAAASQDEKPPAPLEIVAVIEAEAIVTEDGGGGGQDGGGQDGGGQDGPAAGGQSGPAGGQEGPGGGR